MLSIKKRLNSVDIENELNEILPEHIKFLDIDFNELKKILMVPAPVVLDSFPLQRSAGFPTRGILSMAGKKTRPPLSWNSILFRDY